MSAPSATISVQDGAAAAVNQSNNAVVYVTPGNMLTIALQNTVGVISGALQMASADYPSLNQNLTWPGGFTFSLPMPQTPCQFTLVSEVTDGNNAYQSYYTFRNFSITKQVPSHFVRYVCTANVNTANMNVVQDGVTGVAGDLVLLVGQTTKSQNGPWAIGAVAANLTSLSRPADWPSAGVTRAAALFEASEGTAWNGSTWKVFTAGNVTVDTTNISLYPRIQVGTVANVHSASTNNVNTAWIASNTTTGVAFVNNVSNNAVKVGLVTAGAGTGFFVVDGTAADNITWTVMNF